MGVLLRLIFSISLGIGIVLLLVLKSGSPNLQNNGFKRTFNLQAPHLLRQARLPQVLRLAGADRKFLYFSTSSPKRLLTYDLNLNLTDDTLLPLSDWLLARIGKVFFVSADAAHVYIFAGNMPSIIKIDLDRAVAKLYPLPRPAFSYALPISASSFILRRFTPDGRDKYFVKMFSTASRIVPESGLSQVSKDGGFATDGVLTLDPVLRRLSYLHFYNRQVVSFDTNLVMVKKFSTIDSTISPEFKSLPASRKNPILSIHQTGCTYNGKLLIGSNLKADNETYQKYQPNIPVDVYETSTGHYTGSFYLPSLGGSLIRDMQILPGGQLIVLYHNLQTAVFLMPPSFSLTVQAL